MAAGSQAGVIDQRAPVNLHDTASSINDRERHTATEMLMTAGAQEPEACQAAADIIITTTHPHRQRQPQRAIRKPHPKHLTPDVVGQTVTLQPTLRLHRPNQTLPVEGRHRRQQVAVIVRPTLPTGHNTTLVNKHMSANL